MSRTARAAAPIVSSPQAEPVDVDLAFRIGSGEDQPLPGALAPLVLAGGSLTSAAADAQWQRLLSQWLAALAPELPDRIRAPAYSLGLLLTDDATIAALNGQWRHRPEPTDVLAFAALEEAAEANEAGLPLPPLPAPWTAEDPDPSEPLELGDIVISLQTAARQAAEGGGGLERELLFLASHGLLHLLGWDHPDQASLAAMLARQEALIGLGAAAPARA